MNLPELKELMKQHNIRGSSYMNKPEIISRLIEKGVLTLEVVENWKRPPKTTSKDAKYDRLKGIRTNPKRVEILDLETGEIASYSSMYKAGKALNRDARAIAMFNGKVYKNRYEIKVLESSSSSEESTSEEESTTSEEESSSEEESTSEEESGTSEESTSSSEESTSEEESGTSEESTRGVKRTINVTRRGTQEQQ